MPTRVFLLTGVTSFPDPGNWNADDNKVECVGAGGRGGNDTGDQGGAGGGGGAFAYGTNLPLSFPTPCHIQPSPTVSSETGYTAFATTTPTPTAGVVYAAIGRAANVAAAAQGGTVFHPNGFAGGGSTISGGSFSFASGSGGGGAAGPAGAGGLSPGFGNPAGGTADGGTVAAQTLAGQPGRSGMQWGIFGIGGGGAGSSNTVGAGGLFGGGGGGRFTGDPTPPGNGAPGLIVITYTPREPPPPKTRVFLHAGVTSFPNPGNWDANNNKVECLGVGAAGGRGAGAPADVAGGGGGGGGYAWGENLDLTFPAPCRVYDQLNYAIWNSRTACNFNTTAAIFTTTAGAVSAGNGELGNASTVPSNQGRGGQFHPNGFAGGNGAARVGMQGGGAGGAAGPNGAGGAGVGTNGGAADGGTIAGGGAGAGNRAVRWPPIYTIGSGGGGGTSGTVTTAADGGARGGGGGGGYETNNAAGRAAGAGTDGLIVLTWTPLLPVRAARPRAIIMG